MNNQPIQLNRRRVRSGHDMLESCQELARYLYPYPPTGTHARAWWGMVCDQAGVACEDEDLTFAAGLELYAFLLEQVSQVFEDINRLAEQKARKV